MKPKRIPAPEVPTSHTILKNGVNHELNINKFQLQRESFLTNSVDWSAGFQTPKRSIVDMSDINRYERVLYTTMQ